MASPAVKPPAFAIASLIPPLLLSACASAHLHPAPPPTLQAIRQEAAAMTHAAQGVVFDGTKLLPAARPSAK